MNLSYIPLLPFFLISEIDDTDIKYVIGLEDAYFYRLSLAVGQVLQGKINGAPAFGSGFIFGCGHIECIGYGVVGQYIPTVERILIYIVCAVDDHVDHRTLSAVTVKINTRYGSQQPPSVLRQLILQSAGNSSLVPSIEGSMMNVAVLDVIEGL